MIKKLLFIILAIMLAVTPAFASYAGENRIFDQAGVINSGALTQLQETIDAARDKTEMDFVVLTADSKGSKGSLEYAEDFYDENGFGTGDDKSGVVLFLDMEERSFFMVTTGEAIEYYTDDRIYSMTDGDDELYEYLSNGDFAGAFEHALDRCVEYYKLGVVVGQYNYNQDTGEVVKTKHRRLTILEIIISLALPFILAFARIKSIKNEYGMKAERSNAQKCNAVYRTTSAFAFAVSADTLISTDVSRRFIPPVVVTGGSKSGSDTGRSTIHMGGSGTFHGGGGGGRHF